MSNWKGNSNPIPSRWLHCPRKAITLIRNKFLAFKTPLSPNFDSQVPEECRFSIDMMMASLKSQKIKLGLWIDLTNTSRFYDKKSLEAYGCKYLKLQCKGHGETPTEEQTKTFVHVCKKFILCNPLEIIGVHCTHGFNRTGFFIISYLVETDATNVDAGLKEFAIARPPGIYKADYIQELFKRYDNMEVAPDPPPRPDWCLEYDDSNVEDSDEGSSTNVSSKNRKSEINNKNPIFMAGVDGVTPVLESKKLSKIQRRVQEICSWQSNGFPGSQPVSMDENNLRFLHDKPYMVSWKADGTRYMMLIQENGEVHFIDRDNSVFQVSGMSFPHPENETLKDTLLDGEMVIDKGNGKECARYLVYDIVMYNGEDVSKLPFYPNRYSLIEKQVIGTRSKAFMKRWLKKETEPFSVRLKQFWSVNQTGYLLSDRFSKKLPHEPDGLIFQPMKEPYKPGNSPEVLKWKPLSLNSVDFKLRIFVESGVGIIPTKVGYLFVGGRTEPFSKIKLTKQMKDLDNAIIECKYEDNQWIFMRVRTDKSFPNSFNTAFSVCKTIVRPITTKVLLDYIDKHQFVQDDSDLMPPPDRTVMIWCTKELTVKQKRSLRVNIEFDHATLIRWSPDGKAFLIHKAVANTIEVYKISKKTDGTLASATKALEFSKRHTEDVVGMDIACTGKYIITCSKVNDLIVWDLKGQVLATIELHLGSTYQAHISPCGRFIGISGFTPDVNVWEVVFSKSGEFTQVTKAFDLAGHSSGILDFTFSADSSSMATVSKDGTYRLYDTKIEFEKGEDPHVLQIGPWENTATANIALSPNTEVLAIAHGSSLSFYSTITGLLDTTIEDIFLGPITCLAFDAMGEYVLIAGDRHIKVFRNITGCRVGIESARRKLTQKQTSATKERLEKLIEDNKQILQAMGEKCP